jgi:hypothetical protein
MQIFLSKSWAGHDPVLPLNSSASALEPCGSFIGHAWSPYWASSWIWAAYSNLRIEMMVSLNIVQAALLKLKLAKKKLHGCALICDWCSWHNIFLIGHGQCWHVACEISLAKHHKTIVEHQNPLCALGYLCTNNYIDSKFVTKSNCSAYAETMLKKN